MRVPSHGASPAPPFPPPPPPPPPPRPSLSFAAGSENLESSASSSVRPSVSIPSQSESVKMAALRLRTSPPTKEPWQPYMSPVSPTADSPNQAASPSTSLSDRCRQLAFRLGGSAVQDDEHFYEQPTSPTESVHGSPGKKWRQSSSTANESSPPRGLSNYTFGSSGAGGLSPVAPLSPRSHPPTSPDTTHVLNEIIEEGESGGEPRVGRAESMRRPNLRSDSRHSGLETLSANAARGAVRPARSGSTTVRDSPLQRVSRA
mgnify:CR=1 FL=1